MSNITKLRAAAALKDLPGETPGPQAAVSETDSQGYGDAAPPRPAAVPAPRPPGRPRASRKPEKPVRSKTVRVALPLDIFSALKQESWERDVPSSEVIAEMLRDRYPARRSR